jgi:hypothetical protein
MARAVLYTFNDPVSHKILPVNSISFRSFRLLLIDKHKQSASTRRSEEQGPGPHRLEISFSSRRVVSYGEPFCSSCNKGLEQHHCSASEEQRTNVTIPPAQVYMLFHCPRLLVYSRSIYNIPEVIRDYLTRLTLRFAQVSAFIPPTLFCIHRPLCTPDIHNVHRNLYALHILQPRVCEMRTRVHICPQHAVPPPAFCALDAPRGGLPVLRVRASEHGQGVSGLSGLGEGQRETTEGQGEGEERGL